MAQSDEIYKDYSSYSRDLKIWFVSYGIGVPALILTSERLSAAINEAKTFTAITVWFLIGAAIQIIGVMGDKWATYVNYVVALAEEVTADEELVGKQPREFFVRLADWWITNFAIMIIIDIMALFSFGVATYLVFRSIAF